MQEKKKEINKNIDERGNEEDCLFCRVTGTVVFGSFSIYSFLKFLQAEKKSSDKVFFGFVALSFGALSIYRAVTPAAPLKDKTEK